MALKALMLRKKIELERSKLETLKAKRGDLDEQEIKIRAAIDEVETEEEQAAVQAEVEQLDADRSALENDIRAAEEAVTALETELQSIEEAQETEPEQREAPANHERRSEDPMIRNVTMNTRDRLAQMVTRDDVKAFLGEVRTSIKEKRALTGVGLLVPEVLLGLIKENVAGYSKLIKHVNVRPIGGNGRQVVMGTVPEAIWTDCCANLNELNLAFNDVEVDCFKVGGYFAICNATLEDTDVDLADELLSAIGQAIGLALDKAILYGRNASGTQKMPQGIVSRLVQTAQPTGYPATARPWADLHETNVITVPAATTGAALIAAIVTASGAAKGKYSRGTKVWVMNETTYTALMAATVGTNANGQIVSGVANTMPVIGGAIEVLSFVPNNVIIGGYFDNYLLAERAGAKFATSEHVRFLQDQTVFKGTARYDGAPSIAEAFVAIGIGGVTPNATMTFASDTANT